MEDKEIIVKTKSFEFDVAISEKNEEAFALAAKKEFKRNILSYYYLQPAKYRFKIRIRASELKKFFAFLRRFAKSQGITTIETKDVFSTKSAALS